MSSSGNRIGASMMTALVLTGVVFGLGIVGVVVLMLVLNGFSGRQALPFFVVYAALVSAVNLALVAGATAVVLREAVEDRAARRRWMLVNAVLFTALPFAAAFAFFASGGSI